MTRAMYPGSFDPVHLGHLDIVEVAAALFDEVVVVTMYNPGKSGTLSLEEREALLSAAFSHLPNVRTTSAPGLVIDAARDLEVDVVVKGVRGMGDLDVEMQMAQTNKSVAGMQTIFVPTEPERSFVSSRFIREIAAHGGDIGHLVPAGVAEALATRNGS